MHHRQWMVGDVHMDLCQRPPRPADGIECLSAPLGQPFLACQRFGKNALQHMRPARAYIGDSKRTERQGNAFMHLPARHAHKLQAAAAQIADRSEEHTSELQSLMRISYAVFCLKKKTHTKK